MHRIKRSESAFHRNLTVEDREALLQLQTLRDLPKSRYATQSCITALPGPRSRRLTYSHIEVYKMVESIATTLRQAGVRPQTPCAFALNNSIESIVYFLALQWISAVAVPIDPTLSERDIDLILKRLQSYIVVSPLIDEDEREGDELYTKLASICDTNDYIHWFISRSTNQGVYLVMNGKRAGDSAAWAGGASDFKYDPNETAFTLAYVSDQSSLIVPISHRACTHATRDYADAYGLTAEYSMLLIEPMYTIDALISILATMYSGGNIALPHPKTEFENILVAPERVKIDWLSCSADTLLELNEKAVPNSTTKLSFIRAYGGNMNQSAMEDIEKAFGTPILEAYGTPETCGLVSGNTVDERRIGTCGKPIGDNEIGIFDLKESKLVPVDTVGRIGVHTAHVTLMYENNDFANRTCFVTIADEEGDGERNFFLSGDTGHLSVDHYLTITTQGLPKNRVATLAEQEEVEIKTFRVNELEKSRILAEEAKRKEEEQEEERQKAEAEEEKAQRISETETEAEEEEKQEEEEKSVDDAKEENCSDSNDEREEEEDHEFSKDVSQYATSAPSASTRGSVGDATSTTVYDDDTTQQDGTNNSEYAGTAKSSVPDTVQVERAAPVLIQQYAPDPQMEEMMKRILDRLDVIERNQRRFEEETEASNRLEMERLRHMIEELQTQQAQPAPPPVVNMDVINSAVKRAAAHAETSSRDTAAAAKAAEEAAEAAKLAAATAAANKANETSVAEIQDPDSIQKSVLISLEEVEKVMMKHPAVESARAFGRPDPRFGVEVFCAICAKKGARMSEPWLKLHAQSMLAPTSVPKRFFYKDGLDPEGDRSMLSEDPDLQRVSEKSGYKQGKVIHKPSWKKKEAEKTEQSQMSEA